MSSSNLDNAYVLKRTQLIHTDIDTLWQFFSSAKNLSVLTPSYMNFRITSGQLPEKIYKGQIITYKVSPILHIPLNWTTKITEVVENKLFIDEQVKGPYKLWHHEHHFYEEKNGVLMKDEVHYKMPFGPFGKIAYALMVKKQLKDIFDFRHEVIEKRFNRK